jgi:hypothetical protein
MKWLPWIDICLKALALVIGGLWVLMNYYRGRTHKPRLELRIFGERAFRDGLEYLTIRTELKNVGLSRVNVKHDGCMITISAHRLPKKVGFVMEPKWQELANIDLYKGQGWVEPNGLLIDSQCVPLPGLADRFLRILAHFESDRVALTSPVVVAPLTLTV